MLGFEQAGGESAHHNPGKRTHMICFHVSPLARVIVGIAFISHRQHTTRGRHR